MNARIIKTVNITEELKNLPKNHNLYRVTLNNLKWDQNDKPLPTKAVYHITAPMEEEAERRALERAMTRHDRLVTHFTPTIEAIR